MTETDNNTYAYELKIQALLERVSELTKDYESQNADRRVQITLLSEELKRLTDSNNELLATVTQLREAVNVVEEASISDNSTE